MASVEKDSEISAFYKGKTIFITGGTGFIGKVLIEKLLRSCRDVKRIYILIRTKRGKEPAERVKQMFDSKLFFRVKKEEPNCFEKVSHVVGCLESDKLGLSPEDYNTISNEVSIIFHIGANTKFNDNFRRTLISNLLGTKYVIDLAKESRNIEAVVYVSSAFCNTHQENIYEVLYPTECSATDIASCLPWMKEELFERLRPDLLSRHPNNYCYSKCLAEQLFSEEGKSLRVVIVRPTMVLSSCKEPYEGWIDSYNGVTSMSIAISKGLLKTLYNPSKSHDIIPVDYCVNLILASAWHISFKGLGSLAVYNCSTDTLNSAWKKERGSYLWILPTLYPTVKFYRCPNMTIANNKVLYEIDNFFSHLLPALLFDICLLIIGKTRRMFSLYKKLRTLTKDFEYFFCNDWYFHSENVGILLNSMSEEDKKIFDVDVRNINWDKYFEYYTLSLRQYFLEDDPSTLQRARSRIRRRNYVFMGICAIGSAIILRFLLPSIWIILTTFS